MDNLLIAVALLAIALKSTNNQLTYLMLTGCLIASLIELIEFDIALSYSLYLLLLSSLVLYSLKINTTTSRFYCILMLVQMFLCLLLIPDWNGGNDAIQRFALYFTDEMAIYTLLIGVTGRGNRVSNYFNSYTLCNGCNSYRNYSS